MPKPITAGDPSVAHNARMNVLLLTMDSHLASAASNAAHRLATHVPGLNLQTHSASAWRDSDSSLAACLASIAQADIVIVTMLFMEDHFLPVLEALQQRWFASCPPLQSPNSRAWASWSWAASPVA